MKKYDAVIVGAGPNGLAAAIRLATAGLSVLVLEANEEPGGAVRTLPLTLPGFIHDLGSAIHPFAVTSPYFRTLRLDRYGLEWIHPSAPLAHAFPGQPAILLSRSLEETANALGPDGDAYHKLLKPFAEHWQDLCDEILRPVLHFPRHPMLLARFGLRALRSASSLCTHHFNSAPARALFAGLAAHSFLPLRRTASASFGLLLAAAAHAVGWPFPKGGAGKLTSALCALLRELGGEIQTGVRVTTLTDIPEARLILLDLTPRQILGIAGSALPTRYVNGLKAYAYGPGVFRIDYALSRPIPWRDPRCAQAGTVHLGASLEEVDESESTVWQGREPTRPFVLLAQPTLLDPSRAPEGKHIAWVYCHVPNGSRRDMTRAIEDQIESAAPGFRESVLARRAMGCAELELLNQNIVGGDISGGAMNLGQIIARPVLTWNPYRMPVPGLYLCSSSTPPGGGVHGMCGFHAAETALADLNHSPSLRINPRVWRSTSDA